TFPHTKESLQELYSKASKYSTLNYEKFKTKQQTSREAKQKELVPTLSKTLKASSLELEKENIPLNDITPQAKPKTPGKTPRSSRKEAPRPLRQQVTNKPQPCPLFE
ncbi:hypothetical protein DID77_03010, partial [Candidatus Marinamargulisbacteria bacterium SCGC AG-439-L15]